MLWAILIGAFASVCCIVSILLNILFKEKLLIQKRIKDYVHTDEKNNSVLEGSFTDRVIRPIFKNANSLMNRVTPKQYYMQMERRLTEAGNPKGITVGMIVFLQACGIIISFTGSILVWFIGGVPLPKALIILCALLGIINILPKYFLKHKIVERQKEIERSLPDVLDLLTVSIEAGLSFDGAVAKLVEKMPGVLAQEFGTVLKEMRVGVSKKDAFKSLLERVPAPSLVTFVGAVLQADQLGVSVGNVLRIQSAQVRLKRRQKTQENAMKAPIKMLIPMVIFIMPTIFIVLLGPVAIKYMQTFAD
ncbi:MAG: type II secretion system F family protein [Caulobacteraceae bacterium]